ncbi:ABC transporter ATP-binding protein [Cryptosporangium aurantiacum]|uniref:Iron complex transport system ATP-binding protein n=1 Tax=Cryptosporangium aurantiacum TaxID=134849 RepID=A0A1M7RMG8_9ACTN|nr:ABC transporter ATP-binding protein [Cryptosporangium aurantiacum]SHN47525.1 iron complex transport system ATP-binding protein [Cryptosporangium aurantiacum]
MPEDACLATDGVHAGYGGAAVLHDVDVTIPRGRVTTIVGPNGCGKSTLLRVLARLLPPASGHVFLDGEPITGLRARDLAKRLAMLPQNPVAPEGMTVADLAARGRAPHQPWYRQWSPGDEEITADAMAATGVLDLADRPLDELSGGQRQRAWIALSLAQQTDVLLLDEPTTHLDLAHAVEVLELVTRLRDETGRTIVLVLHDLSLAARYSDQLVVLREGRVHTTGAPGEVMTPELLRDVFGLAAHVFPDPVDGLPTVVPARALT